MSAEQLKTKVANAHRSLADPSLLWPVVLLIWVLPFITISEPEDWKASRFGTAPILPPPMIKAIKVVGRGGAIVFLAFSLMSVWRHRSTSFAIGALWPILAFGLYGVASVFWSPLATTSLTASLTFVMLLMLALYTAISWRDDRDTEMILKHLVLAFASISLVLLMLRLGMPKYGALTKEAAGVLHSTNAGATCGLCFLLALAARLLWAKPWTSMWLPVSAIAGFAMLLSGNRLSVVVTVFSVGVLFLLRLNRGVVAFMVLLLVVPATIYLALDPRVELIEQAGKNVGVFAKQGQSKGELSSLSGRKEMWTKMWDSYLESPVVGHGFFVTSEDGRMYVWQEWGNWTAHNVWLQILTTTGLLGAFILVAGFSLLSWTVYLSSKYLKEAKRTLVILTCLSCWFLGWGMLNSSFVGPLQPESLVFALLIGMAGGVTARSAQLRLTQGQQAVTDVEKVC